MGQLGQGLSQKEVIVTGLSEKIGEIGRDRIEEIDALLPVFMFHKKLAILFNRREVGVGQMSGQPGL